MWIPWAFCVESDIISEKCLTSVLIIVSWFVTLDTIDQTFLLIMFNNIVLNMNLLDSYYRR